MSDSNDSSRIAQILAIITIVIGAVFMISGVGAWFGVSSQLADENITVSDDAGWFAGEPVDGPLPPMSRQM